MQQRLAPTPDQLKTLRDELDLADAAAAELNVVLNSFATQLSTDHFFHRAYRLKCTIIQVTPVDKGLQPGQQLPAGLVIAVDDPRLDQSVSLPVPAVGLVVVLHRVEGQRQRPTVSVGPQSHVHPEHNTINRCALQDSDQLPGEFQEKFMIADRFGAIRLPRFRIGENEIDVG